MAAWQENIPAGSWPILLPKRLAAAFVGVSENTFMAEVKAGCWPKPVHRGEKRRRYWSREALADTVKAMAQSTNADGGDDDDWTGRFDDDRDCADEGH